MDVMELGAIGELVGGVAVIATLVYLAAQIRQNTRMMQTTSGQAMSEQVERFTEWLVENEQARELWALAVGWGRDHPGSLGNPAGHSTDALSRFHLVMYRAANASFSQYELWRAGHLGSPQFDQLKSLVHIYSTTPAAIDWWENQAPSLFDVDFLRFVRATRKEYDRREGA